MILCVSTDKGREVVEDVPMQTNEAYCTVTTGVVMKRNEAYETVQRPLTPTINTPTPMYNYKSLSVLTIQGSVCAFLHRL